MNFSDGREDKESAVTGEQSFAAALAAEQWVRDLGGVTSVAGQQYKDGLTAGGILKELMPVDSDVAASHKQVWVDRGVIMKVGQSADSARPVSGDLSIPNIWHQYKQRQEPQDASKTFGKAAAQLDRDTKPEQSGENIKGQVSKADLKSFGQAIEQLLKIGKPLHDGSIADTEYNKIIDAIGEFLKQGKGHQPPGSISHLAKDKKITDCLEEFSKKWIADHPGTTTDWGDHEGVRQAGRFLKQPESPTAEAVAKAEADFDKYLVQSPPRECAEQVANLGHAILKGNVKDIEFALRQFGNNLEVDRAVHYLANAFGMETTERGLVLAKSDKTDGSDMSQSASVILKLSKQGLSGEYILNLGGTGISLGAADPQECISGLQSSAVKHFARSKERIELNPDSDTSKPLIKDLPTPYVPGKDQGPVLNSNQDGYKSIKNINVSSFEVDKSGTRYRQA
jgi:hypothetical protein